MLIVTQVAPYVDGPAGVHATLPQAVTALSEVAEMAGLEPRPVADVRDLSPRNVDAAAVLALFTIGETPWSDGQKDALLTAWQAGRLRVLGIHSATDASHTWPDYGSIVGARFDGHPWTQDFAADVVDRAHPATSHLGSQLDWHDEVYLFRDLRPEARREGARLRIPAGLVHRGRPGPKLLHRTRPLPAGLGAAALPAPSGGGARLAEARRRSLTSMSGSSSVLPEVMSAAVYQAPGIVTVEERVVPRPGPDQVVVRVHSCGICGSDIHQLRDGWGLPAGVIAGHEWSGEIAAVGEGVTSWSVGELVVGGASPRCGACRRCKEGKPSQCENRHSMTTEHNDGAFAEYILARASGVLRLPEGLAPRHAALAEPLSVAMHGITRSGVAPGDSVIVFGAGPIGALSVAALRAMGIDEIAVVEPSEKRQKLAAELGARDVVHPDELDVFPSWEPERQSSRAAHVVLECSGHRAAIEAAFSQVARGGILVMVGAGIDHPTFDINRMILNELTVTGSFVYDQGGFERALELLASEGFPNELLIEAGDVPLNGITQALEDLAVGRIAGKVMVVPEVRT
jgi:L-iditol 2-dehydrogenase